MNTELLDKISNHLRNGELVHKRFEFGTINFGTLKHNPDYPLCAWVGDAVGELPVIFPEHFKFYQQECYPYNQIIVYKDSTKAYHIEIDLARFLDIPIHDVRSLFMPDKKRYWANNTVLTDDATKEIVADSIDAYILYRMNLID